MRAPRRPRYVDEVGGEAFSCYCRVRHAVVKTPRHSGVVNTTKLSDAFLVLLSVLLMMLSSWLSLR
jgi:hypothetical protein